MTSSLGNRCFLYIRWALILLQMNNKIFGTHILSAQGCARVFGEAAGPRPGPCRVEPVACARPRKGSPQGACTCPWRQRAHRKAVPSLHLAASLRLQSWRHLSSRGPRMHVPESHRSHHRCTVEQGGPVSGGHVCSWRVTGWPERGRSGQDTPALALLSPTSVVLRFSLMRCLV